MMTHHFVMMSSLLIKILKIDKFGNFSGDIDFKTKMDIFRDVISLIINQCHLQATEGILRRTRSVRQPRSSSKRSALVYIKSGQKTSEILKHVENLGISRATVYRQVQKLRNGGNTNKKTGSGRKVFLYSNYSQF